MTTQMQPRNDKPGVASFLEKVSPQIFTMAMVAGFSLITLYFTVASLDSRVGAIEESRATILPDYYAQQQQIKQSSQDVAEIKSDVKEILRLLAAKE